ncbi:hypothetical protein PMAC_000572 [Pneumocystis sp. 'macacae']|nr:hypothetical protein PMAC_000572 [Pneumocystis sp. 'macacae']
MQEKGFFKIGNKFDSIEKLETVKKLEKNAKLIKQINFYEKICEASSLNYSYFQMKFNELYNMGPFGCDLIARIAEKVILKDHIINEPFNAKSMDPNNSNEGKKGKSDDIWLDDDILYYPKQTTWDAFKNPLLKSYINPFMTEKSMHIFDLLLIKKLNHIYSSQEAGILIDLFLLCRSLLLLSLGESSFLFSWDEKRLRFLLLIKNLKVSGCTKESTRSIINFFMSIGTHTSRLRLFINSIKKNAINYDPCVLAFVSCITEILKNYSDVFVSDLNNIKEPLFLLNYVQKYIDIEESIRKLASLCYRDLEMFPEPPFQEIKQGIDLLNILYTFVCKNSYTGKKNILLISRFLLKYSSWPWLKMLEQWIGFQKKTPSETNLWKERKNSGFFIHEINKYFENNINLDECFKIDDIHCHYLPKSFFQNVYNIGKFIRLLYKIQPTHPLCKILHKEIDQESISIQLEWKFHWENIKDLVKQMKLYKEIMETEIKKFENLNKYDGTINSEKIEKPQKKSEFEFFNHSEQEIVDSIKKSINLFESKIINEDILPFNKDINTKHLEEDIVPIDLVSMHCFIIPLTVQSNLVNSAIIKLFLKNVELERHLTLLWKAKLFGDGFFILNLSYALFGYPLERNKYSLELNSKIRLEDEWPPKSTELTIALRTILVDTFEHEFLLSKQGFGTESTLLGGLSFFIEEIDELKLKRIKDPYSIEALDFLKIVYTPPFPLNEIITSSCLTKYDQLTNFLLRLIRMNNIVIKLFEIKTNKQMLDYFKITLGFRFHAYYFIYTLFCYIFNIVLPLNYQKLKKYLIDVELNLSQFVFTSLIHFHSDILDHILFSCFLTSSQVSLINSITDIFSIILNFSKTFFYYQSHLDTFDINSLISMTNTLYPSLIKLITKFVRKIHYLAIDKGIYIDLDALFSTKYL